MNKNENEPETQIDLDRLESIKIGRTVNIGDYNSMRIDLVIKRNENETDEQLIQTAEKKLVDTYQQLKTSEKADELNFDSWAIQRLDRAIKDMDKSIENLNDPETKALKLEHTITSVIRQVDYATAAIETVKNELKDNFATMKEAYPEPSNDMIDLMNSIARFVGLQEIELNEANAPDVEEDEVDDEEDNY